MQAVGAISKAGICIVQNGQEGLPQLLSRLSGLMGDPPMAGTLEAHPSTGFNHLLAPLARFQQAMQDSQNVEVLQKPQLQISDGCGLRQSSLRDLCSLFLSL